MVILPGKVYKAEKLKIPITTEKETSYCYLDSHITVEKKQSIVLFLVHFNTLLKIL